MATLNLARQPFVNERPLRRVCSLLIVLACLLVLVNSVLFWRYLSGSAGLRSQLRGVRAEVSAERATIADLERKLAGFDLGRQNRQVLFLNQQIKQRTFGWGLLFERLGEALPLKVRLVSLSPEVLDRRARGNRGVVDERDRVLVSLTGIAADSEQLLAFVDALFTHPSFETPQLMSETRNDRGESVFQLVTSYLPAVTDEAPIRVTSNQGEATREDDGARYDGGVVVRESSTPSAVAGATDEGRVATLPQGEAPLEQPTDPNQGARTAEPQATPMQTGGAPPPRPRATDVRAGRTSSRRDTRPSPTALGGSRFQPGSRAGSPDSSGNGENARGLGRQQPVPRGTLSVPVMPTRNASSPGGRR